MIGLEKFLKAIDDVTTIILGEKRDGNERRVKKVKKKVTRRKQIRRK
jgi:hypothetical protein